MRCPCWYPDHRLPDRKELNDIFYPLANPLLVHLILAVSECAAILQHQNLLAKIGVFILPVPSRLA